MVLKVAQVLADRFFPYQYAYHILIGLISLAVLRAFSQGRTTSRERDLHNRTFLVTGGFTPLGLTLLQNLAERGAKVIALSPYPIDSPAISILVGLLRTTYNNEDIFVEQCNLSEPNSIRDFCMRFLTEGKEVAPESTKDKTDSTEKKENPKGGTDSRLDGIIFAHEYQHIGVPQFFRNKSSTKTVTQDEEARRESNSLATFLMVTLLLPALLVAPVERDIRIINVINPFYAAATAYVRTSKTFNPSFNNLTGASSTSPPTPKSIFLTEGLRSLRTIILTRHLQRIFDALPTKPQAPKTEEGSSSVPIISPRVQRSNIVAISVSPGLSRLDTISRLLNADWSLTQGEGDPEAVAQRRYSWIGVLSYILLLPLLHLTTKTPKAAIQSVLHSLFLPTPFKVLSQSIPTSTSTSTQPQEDNRDDSTTSASQKSSSSRIREEVLKPGALYGECAVVNLDLAISPPSTDSKEVDNKPESSKKGKGKELKEEVLHLTDDGEFGGELAGRMVWEAYETALKLWEKSAGSHHKTAGAGEGS